MASDESVRFVNPPMLPPSPGYTQVVIAPAGRTVHISGQVALDTSGAIVGLGDFSAQARQVFENLKAALEAGGASFADVVKITIFVLDMANLPALREIRDEYVNTERPPASTAVQVSRLAREEFLLEIEAVAVLPG
ncbi:MAG TPA: RidA family protein [Ktedonobacterales bacterium]|jgi:reactive intermediate/imine deaminase|nr:RidA family protein [Ktedonobacterales bacterium]